MCSLKVLTVILTVQRHDPNLLSIFHQFSFSFFFQSQYDETDLSIPISNVVTQRLSNIFPFETTYHDCTMQYKSTASHHVIVPKKKKHTVPICGRPFNDFFDFSINYNHFLFSNDVIPSAVLSACSPVFMKSPVVVGLSFFPC